MALLSLGVCKFHIAPNTQVRGAKYITGTATHRSKHVVEIPNFRKDCPIWPATQEGYSSSLRSNSILKLIETISSSVGRNYIKSTASFVRNWSGVSLANLRSKRVIRWKLMERADSGFVIVDDILVLSIRWPIACSVECRCAGGVFRELELRMRQVVIRKLSGGSTYLVCPKVRIRGSLINPEFVH